MDIAIQAEGLRKRFGDTQALDGVDLVARRGTVLGVLGPNGAGKTTAVRILATLVRPDAGTARVGGFDVAAQPEAVRQTIGLTGQYASVDETLSGTQNLVMIGQLLDLPRREARARAKELLAWFGLTDAADRPARTYSGGMRRRLDLAASLVGRPAVVFLGSSRRTRRTGSSASSAARRSPCARSTRPGSTRSARSSATSPGRRRTRRDAGSSARPSPAMPRSARRSAASRTTASR